MPVASNEAANDGFSMNPAGFGPLEYIMESLILAQNERWRRVLSMQVEWQGQQCP